MARKEDVKGYKGNIALKPINQQVSWTEEQFNEYCKEEFNKCLEND